MDKDPNKGNLVLELRMGERIFVGDDIEITYTKCFGKEDGKGPPIRLRIHAPKNMSIDREKIKMRKLAEQKQ